MAQGRGNAYAPALLLVIIGLQCCCHLASATTYTVGDSKGWDLGIDYTSWTAGKTFKVGDILFFPYMQTAHDVVVVNKAGYDACSDTNAIATFTEGNTNVTLSATGAHYYFCSVVGHCSGGMKLAVTVAATAAPPTAAPAPSKTPSSSPIKAPTTAPPSTSTPSSPPSPSSSTSTPSSPPSPSSPAPAPSAEAPASAPTPSSPASAPTPSSPASTPTSPSAPSSTPSSAGTPTSSPPPPNAGPSLLASASIAPLFALWAALFL